MIKEKEKKTVLEEYKQRIEESKVTVYKAVFPGDTNHHNTMFGGNVMSMMDEIAFLTATRFSRKSIVTVSSSQINFTNPIPSGTIIKLEGRVVRIGRTSLDVEVNIWIESMYRDGQDHAIVGMFTLVAINENRKAVPLF